MASSGDDSVGALNAASERGKLSFLELSTRIMATGLAIILFGEFTLLAVDVVSSHEFFPIVLAHVEAVLGLPICAGVAFALVTFLRQVEGVIEFQGLGFKFKGASGQIIMWVICFLALTIATKTLWETR